MSQSESAQLQERREETPVEMAQRLIAFVYQELESEWRTGATLEEMNKRYREIPKPREYTPYPNATAASRLKQAIRKLFNSLKVLNKPNLTQSPDLQVANPENRGWRAIVQREANGGATIFYSGYHPDDTPFSGHEAGLKVIHAPADGELQIAFIDEVVTPNDRELLVNRIGDWRTQGNDWRDLLVNYSDLPYGQQIEIRRTLRGGSSLLNAIRMSFLLRDTTFGGEFASNRWN